MQSLLFQLTTALLTSFLFLFIFFRKAKREGEAPLKPFHLAVAAIGGLGALAAGLVAVKVLEAGLAELGLSAYRTLAPLDPKTGFPQLPLILLLVLFAALEEGAKVLALAFLEQRGYIPGAGSQDYSCVETGDETRRRGLLLGLCLGLSFGFFENLLYSLGYGDLFLLRQLSTVPFHGFTAALLGRSFDLGTSPLRAFLALSAVHGLYNLCLHLEQPWYLLSFFLLLVLCVRVYRALNFPREDDGNQEDRD